MTSFANHLSGGRAHLVAGSALSGTLALILLTLPGTASAADECGLTPLTPGTVTCLPSANPYNSGVTYVAGPADLTIVLQDGVRIDTTGTANIGVQATGDNAVTVNGGTNTIITTNGDAAYGALITSNVDPLSVTLDRIITSGVNASGVVANSAQGAVAVRTNTITTSGTSAEGINVSTDISPITINSGVIATSGQDATAIVANSNSGNIDITSTAITTTGASSGGAGSGSLGILAQTGGAGTITINSGSINTSGADAIGILAASNTGALLVTSGPVATLGANADAINVTSTGGTATVNSGTITTAGANADGIVAVGAAGATVTNGGTITTAGLTSNGVDASSTTGPVAVTVRNVTTTGNGSQAVVLNATAGNATATVNGALRTTGTTANALTVNSGANAVVNLGTGATFSTVQGDYIRINAAGTSTLNTAATIGNNLNGFALVATGGPITINNTGNLSSDIVLTAGADRINNSGTFTVGANPDFGAGVDLFNNTGLVTLMAGATAPVSPVFTGLETFTNSGTIDLRNTRAGDTLTLPGTYVGTNGTLGLDITSNGTTTTNDQLIIGGAATGTTTIQLNQLAGSVPLFNAGTVLVNAGAGSSATAFGLAGGGLDAGFVRYQVGFDAAGNNFLLTAAPSDTAFRTLNYAEGIRSLWLKSADAVSAQLRARRDTMWSQGGGDTTGRFWMQMHGSEETREGQRDFNAFGQSRLTDTGFQQDYFGGQLGLDISGASGERGGFAFGLTGGYVNSSLNFAGTTDKVKFDVANAGLYASYSSGNLFFNALGKYDHYWAKASAPSAGFQQDFSGNIYGARAEMGLRFGSDSFFIEPAASISYVKNDTNDLTPLGTTIAFDDDDGLRGRIGGRIGGLVDIGGPKMSLYAGANYVHEFKGRDNVTFTSGTQTLTYTNDRLRDYGEATMGVTISQNESVSGFLEANYVRSFSKNNDLRGIEGFGGRAGIRFKF